MHNEEIVIGGLPIEIIRKNNLKNLYIRVNPPEGYVTVVLLKKYLISLTTS